MSQSPIPPHGHSFVSKRSFLVPPARAVSKSSRSLGDPVTFLAVPAMLVAVALAATLGPALLAMRVDPVIALRYE